jgi:LigT-like phosphoesterase
VHFTSSFPKWLKPESIHLTFKFLGSIPESMVDEIALHMEAAAVDSPPFTIRVRDLGVFPDSFSVRGSSYGYYSVNEEDASGWVLWSAGPDGKYDLDIDIVKRYYNPSIEQFPEEFYSRFSYNPTNGTGSEGDLIRVKYP